MSRFFIYRFIWLQLSSALKLAAWISVFYWIFEPFLALVKV